MSMSDPIADMLTRIRNVQLSEKVSVAMPASKVKAAIAKVLKDEGYIDDFAVRAQDGKSTLEVGLKYYAGRPVIEKLERVSRPGLRIFKRVDQLPVVQGGLGVGRTETDSCFVIDSPQAARDGYCHISPPWSANTQVKLAAVYPLPGQFQAAANYQNMPGFAKAANMLATNADIAPSLGRNPSEAVRIGVTTQANPYINNTPLSPQAMVTPNANREPGLRQVDLRLHYLWTRGRMRVRRARVQSRVKLVRGDIRQLPFAAARTRAVRKAHPNGSPHGPFSLVMAPYGILQSVARASESYRKDKSPPKPAQHAPTVPSLEHSPPPSSDSNTSSPPHTIGGARPPPSIGMLPGQTPPVIKSLVNLLSSPNPRLSRV